MNKKFNFVQLFIIVIVVSIVTIFIAMKVSYSTKSYYYNKIVSMPSGIEECCGERLPPQIANVANIDIEDNIFELKKDTLTLTGIFTTTYDDDDTPHISYIIADNHYNNWFIHYKHDKKFYISKISSFW